MNGNTTAMTGHGWIEQTHQNGDEMGDGDYDNQGLPKYGCVQGLGKPGGCSFRHISYVKKQSLDASSGQ